MKKILKITGFILLALISFSVLVLSGVGFASLFFEATSLLAEVLSVAPILAPILSSPLLTGLLGILGLGGSIFFPIKAIEAVKGDSKIVDDKKNKKKEEINNEENKDENKENKKEFTIKFSNNNLEKLKDSSLKKISKLSDIKINEMGINAKIKETKPKKEEK